MLQYDDVLNTQREIIYKQRQQVLADEDVSESIRNMLRDGVEAQVAVCCAEENPADWNFDALRTHYQGWLCGPQDFRYTPGELEHLKKVFNKDDIRVTGGYLNNLELRASNELARHKLLDLLGDFALLGMRIKGRVWASRPGHYANTEFMKQLLLTIRRDGEKPAFKYSPSKTPLMDINKIMSLLPHRYPFLLVDKIFHIDDNSIAGIKNISINEPQFTGHFPKEPIMPGVLLVEALAQVGGLFVLNGVENPEDYSTYFLKIDNVRFKRKVVPGDTLQLEVFMVEPLRRGIASMMGKVFVGGQLACEATLMAQIIRNKITE